LDHHTGSKAELIQSIFRCQFSFGYLQSVSGLIGLPNHMQRNKRIWDECSYNRSLCHDPEFVGHLCSIFPIHLIKTVRLRVKELSELLESDPLLYKKLKIIHLVRDPRGIMASRSGLSWGKVNSACNNVSRLCTELKEDLELIEGLLSRFPNQHYLMKFEDLSVHVEVETNKLFRFLKMPVTVSTKLFSKINQSNQLRIFENLL
jgi:hypothetical protein